MRIVAVAVPADAAERAADRLWSAGAQAVVSTRTRVVALMGMLIRFFVMWG